MRINLGIKLGILLLSASCLFNACRPKLEPIPCFETINDFENTKGWVDPASNNSGTIVNDFGYRSKSSCYINNYFPYGYMFKMKFSEISSIIPTYLEVNCVIKLNSQSYDSCKIVCSVTNESGSVLFWAEEKLENLNDQKKWVKQTKKIAFNGLNIPENYINVFLWNHDSNQQLFVDDIEIKFFN